MRWPFGPPHLTLKPSQKNKETKNKKQSKTKNRKKKKQKKGKKQKNTKMPKKSFSVISQIFLFLVGVQNFPFFDNLAKKARNQKTL